MPTGALNATTTIATHSEYQSGPYRAIDNRGDAAPCACASVRSDRLVGLERRDASSIDPPFDLVRIESYELADLAEWDSAFSNQAPHESLAHTKLCG